MECKCGKKMIEKEKNMEYNMFDEKILLKNIQYWQCEECDREIFGENEKEITRILRTAYLEKKKEVDFSQEILKKG